MLISLSIEHSFAKAGPQRRSPLWPKKMSIMILKWTSLMLLSPYKLIHQLRISIFYKMNSPKVLVKLIAWLTVQAFLDTMCKCNDHISFTLFSILIFFFCSIKYFNRNRLINIPKLWSNLIMCFVCDFKRL